MTVAPLQRRVGRLETRSEVAEKKLAIIGGPLIPYSYHKRITYLAPSDALILLVVVVGAGFVA